MNQPDTYELTLLPRNEWTVGVYTSYSGNIYTFYIDADCKIELRVNTIDINALYQLVHNTISDNLFEKLHFTLNTILEHGHILPSGKIVLPIRNGEISLNGNVRISIFDYNIDSNDYTLPLSDEDTFNKHLTLHLL